MGDHGLWLKALREADGQDDTGLAGTVDQLDGAG
jgi:hypothetical protein